MSNERFGRSVSIAGDLYGNGPVTLIMSDAMEGGCHISITDAVSGERTALHHLPDAWFDEIVCAMLVSGGLATELSQQWYHDSGLVDTIILLDANDNRVTRYTVKYRGEHNSLRAIWACSPEALMQLVTDCNLDKYLEY